MTPEERRLERYRKYNNTSKGQARRKRYEAAHPERATRWPPVMLMRRDLQGRTADRRMGVEDV